jgi:lipoprotein-anchoring transpeptidase ErfK/SrfK
LKYPFEDQSFPARPVKGFAGIAAITGRSGVISVTAIPENRALTGSLLAKSAQLWPLSHSNRFILRGRIMTRAFALLFAAVVVLAGAGQARAQGFFDMRDVMGGGGNFGGGGSSPIPRQTVSFSGQYAPGTIYINTAERRLYLVLANGQALRYGIGVGRDGFRWGGTHRISAKKEWPSWTPPSQMLRRRPDLPRHMAGGVDNPLGARAMYLGSTLYRIHGSNEPETIGQAVSSGCFRMTNEDVTDLYSRVSVGATVVVKN